MQQDFEYQFPTLQVLSSDITKARKAYELLLEIFSELGPYTESLSPKLRQELNSFFNFDDSE